MKILYGLTQPDTGLIEADGVQVTINSPRDARAAGIGMVTQHFSLVKNMTVVENIALASASTFSLDLESYEKKSEQRPKGSALKSHPMRSFQHCQLLYSSE